MPSARELAAELKRVRAQHHSAAVAAFKAGAGHRIEVLAGGGPASG